MNLLLLRQAHTHTIIKARVTKLSAVGSKSRLGGLHFNANVSEACWARKKARGIYIQNQSSGGCRFGGKVGLHFMCRRPVTMTRVFTYLHCKPGPQPLTVRAIPRVSSPTSDPKLPKP